MREKASHRVRYGALHKGRVPVRRLYTFEQGGIMVSEIPQM